MSLNHEENVETNALELISSTSTWLLLRHQWIIDNMRAILTGENAPTQEGLHDFNVILPTNLRLPDNLMLSFTNIKNSLESLWVETTKASHPLSGFTVFEQLNKYQQLAHRFMVASKEANEQLWHDFTMRDTLTGAWSRLSLISSLVEELNRYSRYHIPSTIALLDQDRFKLINDRWGHVAGDMVLAKTAEIIQNNLRPNDKLFRYGGDEWVILMPGTTNEMAHVTIERIQQLCAGYTFKSKTGEKIHSTFTFGIAECCGQSDVEQWIMDADHQLYAKKLNVNLSLSIINQPQATAA